MKYMNQQKYSECALISLFNAAIYHNLPVPEQYDQDYMDMVILAGCLIDNPVTTKHTLNYLDLYEIEGSYDYSWINSNFPCTLVIDPPDTNVAHNVLVIETKDDKLLLTNYLRDGELHWVSFKDLKWKSFYKKPQSIKPYPKERCLKCSEKYTEKIKDWKITHPYKPDVYKMAFNMIYYECPKCQNIQYSRELKNRINKAQNTFLRQFSNLLTPEEIQSIRGDLTYKEFGRLLGLCDFHIVEYERGITLQKDNINKLMMLYRDCPEARKLLKTYNIQIRRNHDTDI